MMQNTKLNCAEFKLGALMQEESVHFKCVLIRSYLLPAKLIGIGVNASSVQIEGHLNEFNSILKTFEVNLTGISTIHYLTSLLRHFTNDFQCLQFLFVHYLWPFSTDVRCEHQFHNFTVQFKYRKQPNGKPHINKRLRSSEKLFMPY
jgi:hypothetical protein